jgi:membrane-bound metal-dependent hydrolase YbcI (DUF457 family)
MANFKTHITCSTVLGIGYGAGAHLMFDVPLPTTILAGGLCAVSGMLPDIDSDTSTPLRESLAFAAAVVPMMMADRFRQLGLSPEYTVLAGAGAYLFIRFVVGYLLKRYTVHRGMFHSLPAALIAGELAYLLSSGPTEMRIYKAGAVVLGYLTHLMLDEIYSIEWYRGRLRLKKSFGTALKIFGRKWWPNGSTYVKLALLTLLVLKEPGWMDQVYQTKLKEPVEHTARQIEDHLLR